MQILVENIKHYYQLKEMIGHAKSTEDYLRLVNSGLDNSMGLLTALPVKDENILSEIQSFKQAVGIIENVYGNVPKSKEQVLQLLNDQTVAESIRMSNSFKRYSEVQEENAVRIAIQSRQASPKGAARMQAEVSAQILGSMSQLIRLNTQMLKMQSEQFAMQNKNSKGEVANFIKVNDGLSNGFKNFKLDMSLGKF
jgi:23S rRNA pseudoU1915 N3-methylase RlmH